MVASKSASADAARTSWTAEALVPVIRGIVGDRSIVTGKTVRGWARGSSVPVAVIPRIGAMYASGVRVSHVYSPDEAALLVRYAASREERVTGHPVAVPSWAVEHKSTTRKSTTRKPSVRKPSSTAATTAATPDASAE